MRLPGHQTLFFILLFPATMLSADTGTLRGQQPLYKNKSPHETITSLQIGEVVDILAHSDSWFQVRTAAGKQGWIPLSSVKLDVNRNLSVYLKNAAQSPFSRQEETDPGIESVESTGAIRGLRHDNLDVEGADREAVKALDAYVQEPSEVKNFANDLGLKSTKLEYLAGGNEKAESTTTTTTGEDTE